MLAPCGSSGLDAERQVEDGKEMKLGWEQSEADGGDRLDISLASDWLLDVDARKLRDTI